jgi:hypothetical protein
LLFNTFVIKESGVDGDFNDLWLKNNKIAVEPQAKLGLWILVYLVIRN